MDRLEEARELLGRLTLAELIEVMRMAVDDIELRTMEKAEDIFEDDLK